MQGRNVKTWILLTNIIHFFTGFIASLNPYICLSITLLFMFYQYIDVKYNLEDPRETLHDIIEYVSGLITGFLVSLMLGT
jgi:hypothetical protein